MASVYDLPLELLLNIIEYERQPHKRLRLLSSITATCFTLHAKTLHYFGSRYLTYIKVSLTEKDVAHLLATSRSALQKHVKHLVIDLGALYEEVTINYSASTEDSQSEWFDESAVTILDPANCECFMDDSVAQFLENGSCKEILGKALSSLRALEAIQILGPRIILGKYRKRKTREIERRRDMAAKVVLDAIFTSAAAQRVVISSEYERYQMPLSALKEVDVSASPHISSMQKLRLSLLYDIDEASSRQHAKATATLFHKLPNLVDLHLSLLHYPSSYLTSLSNNLLLLHHLHLQRLHLAQVTTNHRALTKILDATAPTLQSFRFTYSTLSSFADWHKLLLHLQDMPTLRQVMLDCVNVGDKGVRFGRLHAMRPAMVDLKNEDEDWVLVLVDNYMNDMIVICADEGDDLGFWLEQTCEHAERRLEWYMD